jgi:nicotinate phosphoribosyltransferase
LIAKSYFVGTSNVRLAMKYGVKPIGTKAHEWYQAHSQLAGLEHANRAALEAWINVYHSALGIALTDTYGTDAFLRDFSRELAMAYDGVRHDSGDPFKFVDKFVAHYEKLGIDPLSKTAVFSDSLNVEKAIKIHRYCQNKIKDSFGIGTFFTNDFPKSAFKPLNIVIKLVRLNGKPVVKLSDDFGKSFGERDAVRVARYTHMGIPLDMAN